MFEKEILIATLRRQKEGLSELIKELEMTSLYGSFDEAYCFEAIRRIEKSLKRLRSNVLV